ncbi:MAG: hypothetical protein V4447_10650 [Pseudomonadota bacterium]
MSRTLFQLGFEISPIILVGGIAAAIPGNMLPIIAITQASSFVLGLLQGNADLNPDNYFARFMPVAGGTLINNQIGQYPFANQTVAANAIVSQPNTISMEMICPVREAGGYTAKLTTITALKQTLDNHIAAGGTFTIATPAYIYTNCVLLQMRDVTGGDTKQKQAVFQFDFMKPLLTLEDATTATNSLMSKIANGLPQSGQPTWSGLATSVGSTVSGAISNIIPSASNLVATLSGNYNGANPSDNTENSFGGT